MEELNNYTSVVPLGVKPETIMHVVNLALGVSLNIILLIVIHRQREIQDLMRVLHRILAIKCLANGICWNVWSILWFALKDRHSCSLITFIFVFPFRLTTVTLMACLCGININKYLLISHPMRYHKIVTPKRVKVALFITLIIVLMLSGRSLPVTSSPIIQYEIERCVMTTIILELNTAQVMDSISLLLPVIITFVLSVAIYINLLRTARRQLQRVNALRIHGHDGSDRSDIHGQQRKPPGLPRRFKGAVTVALLTGSFIAVWAPLCVCYLIPGASSGQWLSILNKLASSVCWVQPLVYLMTNREAKETCIHFIRRGFH